MTDPERERLIQIAYGRMQAAWERNDHEAARRYGAEMGHLIGGRSPDQVRRMERERGLAA